MTYYERAKRELDKVNPEDFNNADHLAEYITELIILDYVDYTKIITDEEADKERDKVVKAVYKAIKEL
jgi:hypothetical protein